MKKEEKPLTHVSLFEKKEAVEKLIEESAITKEFYFLLFSSVGIITLGLILDNASIVIGGMLITPLLSSLLTIGLGIVLSNKDVVIRNFVKFSKLFVSITVISFMIAFIVNAEGPSTEILLRTSSRFEYFLVALIAGIIGTYFWVKPHLQNLISGIIIAVALVPPISSLGIGLSLLDKEIISGSLMFFVLNFTGILFGSILMFSLFGFGKTSKKTEKKLEKKLEENCK